MDFTKLSLRGIRVLRWMAKGHPRFEIIFPISVQFAYSDTEQNTGIDAYYYQLCLPFWFLG